MIIQTLYFDKSDLCNVHYKILEPVHSTQTYQQHVQNFKVINNRLRF